MKRFIAIVAVILSAVTFAFGKDVELTMDQLPKTAQRFLSKNFSREKLQVIKYDGKKFEVKYKKGLSVEFDNNGDWTEIDGGKNGVPESALPEFVSDWKSKNHPGVMVKEISKKKKGDIEAELVNKVKVLFTSRGKLKKVIAK